MSLVPALVSRHITARIKYSLFAVKLPAAMVAPLTQVVDAEVFSVTLTPCKTCASAILVFHESRLASESAIIVADFDLVRACRNLVPVAPMKYPAAHVNRRPSISHGQQIP